MPFHNLRHSRELWVRFRKTICNKYKNILALVAKRFDTRAEFTTSWPLETEYSAIYVICSKQIVKMHCSAITTIKSHHLFTLLLRCLELSAVAVDKSSRDRQQPMQLHCCAQLETWCLKKICKVFGGTDTVRRS